MILQRVGWLSVVRSFRGSVSIPFGGTNGRRVGRFRNKSGAIPPGWCDATRKYCPTVSVNCRAAFITARFTNMRAHTREGGACPPLAWPHLVLIVPRGARDTHATVFRTLA